MDNELKSKLDRFYFHTAEREVSKSKHAACLICCKVIEDDERFRVNAKHPQGTPKCIHIECYENAKLEYNETKQCKDVIEDSMTQDDMHQDWDFLPAGNAYLTKVVKKIGPYEIRSSKIQITKRKVRKTVLTTVGIRAPKENIEKAKAMEQQTEDDRKIKRDKSSVYRGKREGQYAEEFYEAVLQYLNFSHKYDDIAEEIAHNAASHACEVGSERVGRTKTIPLAEKAAMGARAYIRHNHTTYDDKLRETANNLEISELPKDMYRDIKSNTMDEVTIFINKHRE